MIEVKPVNDKIALLVEKKINKSEGGLYLPEKSVEKPDRGIVAAVGPGKVLENGTRAPMSVKEDDRVLFRKGVGTRVEYDDDKVFIIVSDSDILAVINDVEE